MNESNRQKEDRLRKDGCFNPRAEAVGDPLFEESEFFDPRDLVLVKYEMLRRVQVEDLSVPDAAKRFGFSRSGFYKVLSAFKAGGLLGLIPSRPGPRQAHKLTDDLLEFLDQQRLAQGTLSASELAALLLAQREVSVHPRSVERALARREKRGR